VVAGKNATFLEAAQLLNVVVHASGPLLEAELLKRLTGSLDDIPDVAMANSTGGGGRDLVVSHRCTSIGSCVLSGGGCCAAPAVVWLRLQLPWPSPSLSCPVLPPPHALPLWALAGSKLVQLVRRAPGLTTALVGHKAREHVQDNVALARVAPMRPGAWRRTMREVQGLLQN
jgi:hypothetical protein